jgi:hypothetical protein
VTISQKSYLAAVEAASRSIKSGRGLNLQQIYFSRWPGKVKSIISVELQQCVVDGVMQSLDRRTIAMNQLNKCLDHAKDLIELEGTPDFISKSEWAARMAYVYKTFEENDGNDADKPENGEIDRYLLSYVLTM